MTNLYIQFPSKTELHEAQEMVVLKLTFETSGRMMDDAAASRSGSWEFKKQLFLGLRKKHEQNWEKTTIPSIMGMFFKTILDA